MLAGTIFDTEMHTRIGKCDKALEPAINETVNKKKFGKRLTNPDLSIDITVREKNRGEKDNYHTMYYVVLYKHNLKLGANQFHDASYVYRDAGTDFCQARPLKIITR